MPPRKRPSSVLNGDHGDPPKEADPVTDADDALAAAEEAEAEAAEAEAVAAAARARARAIRLRREAAAAAKKNATADTSDTSDATAAVAVADVEATAIELDAPTTDAPTEVVAAEPEPSDEDLPGPPVIESTIVDEPVVDEPDSPVVDEPIATTDDDEVDEPADEPAPSAWATRKRTRIRVPALAVKIVAGTVAVLCSAALIALTVTMFVQHRNVEHQRELAAEFSAAARQSVVTLMSLNFNNAKEDVQRILDNTTGEFRKDFEGQAEDFVKVAQESKVVTEANVNAVAVQRMDERTATVLVAVVTNVSNVQSDQQAPRSWRLAVDVARDGDQIKLAKVEFVP